MTTDKMLDKREVVQENLYVLESKLGWILSGRTTIRESQDENILFLLSTSSDIPSELHKMNRENQIAMFKPNVEDLWNLENIGIKPKEKGERDDFVMDWFKDTVSRKDKRYFLSWPWREENESHLPENFELSLGRLKSLIKRLEKNPDLLEKYNNVIQEQIAKGIIERVESSEEDNENRKHYIPHHAVITPEKTTTKIRIVYDASAKIKRSAKSLNECLYRGPVILEDLCGLLLRFRMKKIGLVSDIEKAFLQVGLHEADRDVTRFLWLKDIQKPVSKDNLLVCRFKRLSFGIISSPFLLGATIKHHLEKENSATAKSIKNDFYVDNLITGADNEKDAIRLYRDAKRLFEDVSMNLRECLTNSLKVNNQIKQKDQIEKRLKYLVWFGTQTQTSYQYQQKSCKFNNQQQQKRSINIFSIHLRPTWNVNTVYNQHEDIYSNLWKKGLDWDDKLHDKDKETWKNLEKNDSRYA